MIPPSLQEAANGWRPHFPEVYNPSDLGATARWSRTPETAADDLRAFLAVDAVQRGSHRREGALAQPRLRPPQARRRQGRLIPNSDRDAQRIKQRAAGRTEPRGQRD
jgi:hypothetical protein